MNSGFRRILLLLPLFAPLPLASSFQPPRSEAGQPANQTPAPATPAPTTFDSPAYSFQYSFPADKSLYFVIENNFVDRGGVPPLLSFTTYADDKRTIIQSRAPLEDGSKRPSLPGELSLQWVCDRYEVRERGMKEEVKFDSLRDSYPRAELRELGTAPNSKVTFEFNIRTGQSRNRRIEPNRQIGPPTRRRLSRTTMRCAVNEENLSKLMDDLGPLFLPPQPVHVGESWTTTRSETIKSFGQSHLDYRFKLEKVKEVEGRQVAVIQVGGESRLVPEPQPPKPTHPPRRRGAATQPALASQPAGTSQPVTSQPAVEPEKPREFKIDHFTCRGTIEFDLTRGELVSIDLTRELDLSVSMESKEMPGLRLETGSAHRLRVNVLQSPPPKPIIAGGPKPPADDPPEPPMPGTRNKRSPQPTSRPSQYSAKPLDRHTASLYNRATSQAAKRPGAMPYRRPTTPLEPFVGPPFRQFPLPATRNSLIPYRPGSEPPSRVARPVPATQPNRATPASKTIPAVRGKVSKPITPPPGQFTDPDQQGTIRSHQAPLRPTPPQPAKKPASQPSS